MHGELVKVELEDEIVKGKGCIVFDFGCYFPYLNQEDLYFDFQLGEEKMENVKLNHRYPNHGYVTISRKNGRRISKLGYPYFVDLSDTPKTILLVIKVGIKEEYLTSIFPVNITLTKEKPVCALSMRFMFEDAIFHFYSHKKNNDGIGWKRKGWFNNVNPMNQMKEQESIKLDIPTPIDDFTVMYRTVLEPVPQELKDLMI